VITQPLTRDVSELVDALAIVEAELGFQISRLRQNTGSSEQERDHLVDMMGGYIVSYRYVGLLKRYHSGRVERRESSVPQADGVSADGRVTAVVTDEVEE
jgi:hypothetical protein